MFKLSSIFKDPNEEYLVIPSIKNFCKQNGNLKIPADFDKAKMLTFIENYANASAENEERVQCWLDKTVREGIKEIQIEYRELKNETELLFASTQKMSAHLNAYLSHGITNHVCGNNYTSDTYQFVKYELEEGPHGMVAVMFFCKKMHFVENKHEVLTTRVVDYPIVAEYYLDKAWLCIRFKARTGLYNYKDTGYDVNSKRISAAAEVQEVTKQVESILGLEISSRDTNSSRIRRKLFVLLDKYTHTPAEILNVMATQKVEIDKLVHNTLSICKLPSTAITNVTEDINNLVEKYFSIYWPDTAVFTQDREAYPIHLSAIDEENSRVDQKAGLNKPLQSRAVFFDNKRMLYQQKSCESIQFFWKRKNGLFAEDAFPVKICEDKGRCSFKFSQYTLEEDIENVLFSIIDA